jgi:hypothetical protein
LVNSTAGSSSSSGNVSLPMRSLLQAQPVSSISISSSSPFTATTVKVRQLPEVSCG